MVALSGWKNLLVIGDFNFHVDISEDRDAQRFLDILNTRNFKQHVTDATHVSGHTLDLVISRSSDKVVNRTCAKHYISDHAAVHIGLHLSKPPNLTEEVTY